MQYNNKNSPLKVTNFTRDPIPKTKEGMKFHFHKIGDEIGWVLEDGSFYPESEEVYKRYVESGTYVPVPDNEYYGERQWKTCLNKENLHFVFRDGKYWWISPDGTLSQKEPSCYTPKRHPSLGEEVPRSQFYKKSEEEIEMETVSCRVTDSDLKWLKEFAMRHGWECTWAKYTHPYEYFVLYPKKRSVNGTFVPHGKEVHISEIVRQISIPVPSIKVGEYNVKFDKDGTIQVGCQTIDFNKIEEIYFKAKNKKEDNAN